MDTPFLFIGKAIPEDHHYTLDENSSNHCVRVLRMRPGENLILTDGNGLHMDAVIEKAEKKHCSVRITASHHVSAAAPGIGIGISFTKNISRTEWFLEKATEIGVTAIYPLECKRTERTHYKFPRLRQIMVSAMLQSQQYYLPELHESIPLDKLIDEKAFSSRFIAHCEKEEKKPLVNALVKGRDTLILIGPEGDFTPEEIAQAKAKQFLPVSLGNTRLRTETAGIVAATWMTAIREETLPD